MHDTDDELRARRVGREAAEELEADAHAASEESIRHLTGEAVTGDAPPFLGERRIIVERGTRHVSLDEYRELIEPRSEEELLAAGAAVQRARDDAEALELLDKLGTFEQLLMERAFAAGIDATIARLRDAVGSAAETVNAGALKRLLRPPALDARLRPPLPPAERTLQAARLAMRAAETARIAHDPPAGQRMLDVRQALEALEERARRFHIDDDAPPPEDVEDEQHRREALITYAEDLERLILSLRSAVEGEVP